MLETAFAYVPDGSAVRDMAAALVASPIFWVMVVVVCCVALKRFLTWCDAPVSAKRVQPFINIFVVLLGASVGYQIYLQIVPVLWRAAVLKVLDRATAGNGLFLTFFLPLFLLAIIFYYAPVDAQKVRFPFKGLAVAVLLWWLLILGYFSSWLVGAASASPVALCTVAALATIPLVLNIQVRMSLDPTYPLRHFLSLFFEAYRGTAEIEEPLKYLQPFHVYLFITVTALYFEVRILQESLNEFFVVVASVPVAIAGFAALSFEPARQGVGQLSEEERAHFLEIVKVVYRNSGLATVFGMVGALFFSSRDVVITPFSPSIAEAMTIVVLFAAFAAFLNAMLTAVHLFLELVDREGRSRGGFSRNTQRSMPQATENTRPSENEPPLLIELQVGPTTERFARKGAADQDEARWRGPWVAKKG